MDRVKFEYEVRTVLRLSKGEVAQLTEACESHYDHAVRSLSVAGPNAVINMARNMLGADEWVDVAVTARQLDTLCKATEQMSSIWVTRQGTPDIHAKLRELLKANQCEQCCLNGQ